MGITGLLPFITDPQRGAIRTASIREFKGQTAAVDGYVLLHRGAFACAKQLFNGEDTDVFVGHCMRYMDLLQRHGVRPLLVFDGAALAAKRSTERQRRDLRKTARKQAVEFLSLGKTADAYQAMARAIDVTHKMALCFIQAARKRGIDSIVAPYEADAQLAHLTSTGLAHFVITEDSDLIVFGCEKILFKLQLTGEGRFYDKSLLEGALCTKKLRCNNYSFDKFRIACILSGCDYIKSLPGIGLAKSWKFASITESLVDLDFKLPKMGQYLNMSSLDVSEEYIRQVKIANCAFKYQVVYDPIKRRRTFLEEYHEGNTNCVITTETVGQVDMDENESLDRALGNIDPMSGAHLDNYRPSDNITLSSSSIWNRNRLSQSTLTTVITATRNQASLKKSSSAPSIETLTASSQELEAQDKRLANLLQQYVKTDTKMCSTVKACYFQDLYEGQNEDTKYIDEELKTDILAKNPFIKKKQIDSAEILNNEEMKEVTQEQNDDLKRSSVIDKTGVLFNRHKKNEKCPFKKQRNNRYDQLLVQKRKAGDNEYFINNNNKKYKIEDANKVLEDKPSNLIQDTEADLSGKEHSSPIESEIMADTALSTKNSNTGVECVTALPITNNDIVLLELNPNIEIVSNTHDCEESDLEKIKAEDELTIVLNTDNVPSETQVDNEIATLCQDVDTISVQSDESEDFIPTDQILQCILTTNDDHYSPIKKILKKNDENRLAKGKKQTNLLDFFKKV